MISHVMHHTARTKRKLHASSIALALAASLSLTAHAAEDVVPANHNPTLNEGSEASDGPAKPSPWSYAAKQGIGASYEAYKNFQFSDDAATGTVSKVWFSLAQGIITETMWGRIHEAQIREMQIVVTGNGYTAFERTDTISRIDYIHKDKAGRPLSPAYRITNTDKKGRFVIIKDVFSDPDHQSLMVRVTVKALKHKKSKLTAPKLTAYVLLDPSLANTSGNDQGNVDSRALQAFEGKSALSLRANVAFVKTNVGFTGTSDGLESLAKSQDLGVVQASTGGQIGNITMIGQLPSFVGSTSFDLALGFGATPQQADEQAQATLKTGYSEVLARYNGKGSRIGWQDYLASLSQLNSLVPYTEDNGKLLYASALALKVQEDRTLSGALIASLSNPWGDGVYTKVSATGYKAVWPRDFYQVAMAMAALGDKETPVAAYRYLPTVQVGANTLGNTGDGGWFLQKSHVDGTPEWVGVQLDQTAMPILLGWKLQSLGMISKSELISSYNTMLKPAANFLSYGGTVNIGWNHSKITPPYAQQERWEEQEGHSPSTTAAIIAGLSAASDIATMAGDTNNATIYADHARDYSQKLEQRLFTTSGMIRGDGKPAAYYLRISRSDDANNPGTLGDANGHNGLRGDMMIDQGFIELVRYGVRRADDKAITASLAFIDDQTLSENLRVRYDFKFKGSKTTFPGFRRYGNDGYGDTTTGHNYAVKGLMDPDQRGRVWPIFTGERGHYQLALASLKPKGATTSDINSIRHTYVKAMELFANEGLMIPEQVFEGVGEAGAHQYVIGEGTDSATPLAWSHAEYVKLLRSLRDKKVWDQNPVAYKQFIKH